MRLVRSISLLVFTVVIALVRPLGGEDKKQSEEITVRGRIVVLDESGQPRSHDEGHNGVHHRFGLRSSGGKIYRFSPTDPKARMFVDPRVQKKELQITGWLRRGYLEVIRVHSVRGHKLYDLYYRCEVCNITSFEPGPCWCCQDEFEFRETLAGEKK